MVRISGLLPQKGQVNLRNFPDAHLELDGPISKEGHVRFRENGWQIGLARIGDEVEIIYGQSEKRIADCPAHRPCMKAMGAKLFLKESKDASRPVHVLIIKKAPV